MYQKLMSPSDNLSKMSLFFAIVHIRAIKDMVHEDITLFQEICEQTNEEQEEASFLYIRRYFDIMKT